MMAFGNNWSDLVKWVEARAPLAKSGQFGQKGVCNSSYYGWCRLL